MRDDWERQMLFLRGFGDGAKCSAIRHKNEPDYMEGLEGGRRARLDAMAAFRNRYGLKKKTNWMRTAEKAGMSEWIGEWLKTPGLVHLFDGEDPVCGTWWLRYDGGPDDGSPRCKNCLRIEKARRAAWWRARFKSTKRSSEDVRRKLAEYKNARKEAGGE